MKQIKNIKLVTLMNFKGQYGVQRNETSFENLNQLKNYIKSCGGIKSFKWNDPDSECKYFIVGEYEKNYGTEECYYEYKYGKYQWFDCNGYLLK